MNLHITAGDLRFQSRIDRVTQYLKHRGYFERIEIAGINPVPRLARSEIQDDGRMYRRFRVREWLRRRSRLGRAADFLLWYCQVGFYYLPRRIACVNAHTLSVLPLCWLLARLKGCALIYEPHELETETRTNKGAAQGILRLAEGWFARRADCVVLVNRAIADWYRHEYGLARTFVIRNLPGRRTFADLPEGYYADRFGYSPDELTFLYQGIIGEGRGVALLLAAARRLGAGRHIVFLGFGAATPMVEEAARACPNIHYHPAVPSEELLRYSAAANVGLLMIEDVSLSYRYCYPNKYCEYLTAGIPVIYSNFLWLGKEVEHYRCGWSCAYDADTLAQLILSIDRDAVSQKRQGACDWSRQNSWDEEVRVIDEIYSGMAAR